jgi:hypothetical protein
MVIHSICFCRGFDENIKVVVATNSHGEPKGYQMPPKYLGEEVIGEVNLFTSYGQCGDAHSCLCGNVWM